MSKMNKKKKQGSIKTKLIVLPLIIILLGVIIMGGVTTYISRKNLIDEMKSSGLATMHQLESRVIDNQRALDQINNNLEEKIYMTGRLIVRNQLSISSMYLKSIALDGDIVEINWFNRQGKIVHSSISEYVGWEAPEDHPVRDFIKGNEEFVVEDIREDSESGEHRMYGYVQATNGYFVQVGINADRVEALKKEFSYQTIMDEVAESEDIVYGLFINKDAVAVAHSNHDRIGKKLTDDNSIAGAVHGEFASSEFYYETEDVNVYDIVYPLEIDGEHVGALNIGFSMKKVYGAIMSNWIIFISLGTAVFLMIGGVLYFFSNGIVKAFIGLAKSMERMAAGDFTMTPPEKDLKRNDELGVMSRSVKEMLESMREALGEVKSKSSQVNHSANALADTSDDMSRSSQELAETIQQVAEGATNQARDLDDIVNTIGLLTSNIDKVYHELENVKKETDNAESKANAGKKEMDILVASINQIKEAFTLVANKVQNLTHSVDEINGITQIITNISEQTNLLALNAAIEAARAGEHGKGFAVVADEVRKLAEESTESTAKISNLVDSIARETKEVIETSQNVESSVTEQTTSVKKTVDSFGEILNSVEKIAPLMDSTYLVMDEIIESKETVVSRVEAVSAITEENSAATQQVAASSEEMTASSEEVAATAQRLSDVAINLQDQVKTFKIDEN